MAFALERTFSITKSCSAISENLQMVSIPEQRVYHMSVIHKHVVCVASCSPDDENFVNCRLVESGDNPSSSEVVYQAKWLTLGQKTVFVMSSDRGFQIFEADGVSLIHTQSFLDDKQGNDIENVAARCAGSIGTFLLIGRSDGAIQAYPFPLISKAKCETFTHGHSAVVDIATSSENPLVGSCDDGGTVILWTVPSNGLLQILSKVRVGSGWPCTGLSFWKRWIIVSVTSGAVHILHSKDLGTAVVITAHFRSLTAMDVMNRSSFGLLLTASEDTHFRVFALRENSGDIEIEQCAAGVYPNQYICGARFLTSTLPTDSSDLKVALSSFESPNIAVYKCKLS